jgi:anti-sigma factor RsiW
VSCVEVLDLIGPLVDGELDLRSCAEVERHLAGCAGCSAERDSLLALRELVRARLPVHEPPQGMEARLLRTVLQAERSRPERRRWRLAPALLLPLAAAAALALWVRPPGQPAAPGAEPNPAAVFEAHLRSLQAAHLTDVRSSDRHTVKPWFEGKLDYAMPVPDLGAQGVVLEGGRLDHLGGRPVAALVYRSGLHAVNLFLWPEPGLRAARVERARGLAAVGWARGGFACWLVSDLAEGELLRVAGLLQEAVK